MLTNVTKGTMSDRLKKKQQIAFRRLMLGQAPSYQIREYVGLNYLEIKAWISKRMIPGMSWNNYGDEWHIAHVVHLSHFDLTKEEDCRLAWNYRNLFPLFNVHFALKEWDIGFSQRLLQKMPTDPIVDKLRAIVDKAIVELREIYFPKTEQ
jgi:hypothetical protein